MANFPQAGADPGPRNGTFPTDPMLQLGHVSRAHAGTAEHTSIRVYPAGTTVRNSATVTWDDPEPRATLLPSDSVRDTSARSLPACRHLSTTSACTAMTCSSIPNLNIAHRDLDTARRSESRLPRSVRRAQPEPAPGERRTTTRVRAAHDAIRIQHLRRAERVGRKAVLATTSAPAAHIPTAIRAASRPARATRRNCRSAPTSTARNTRRCRAPTARTTSTSADDWKFPKQAGVTLERDAAHDDGRRRFTIQDDTLDLE